MFIFLEDALAAQDYGVDCEKRGVSEANTHRSSVPSFFFVCRAA